MDKISHIKANILQLIETKGITKADFCRETGIPYSNFRGKSLESEIGGSMIAQILYTYPEISADWLLTGTGDIFKKTPTITSEDDEDNILSLKIEMMQKMIQDKDLMIEQLNKMIEEKNRQFDDQLKAKDAQINSLLSILSGKDHAK